jgi:hypothetical protein
VPRQGWVRVRLLSKAEKEEIAGRCERFIAEVLKPRFLPEIRPTEFNYPVDIKGRWRGSRYSFIQRYRSGQAHNLGEEWDSAFTRLDHVEDAIAGPRFNIMWMRHTGEWWLLHREVALDQAFELIATEELLWP